MIRFCFDSFICFKCCFILFDEYGKLMYLELYLSVIDWDCKKNCFSIRKYFVWFDDKIYFLINVIVKEVVYFVFFFLYYLD